MKYVDGSLVKKGQYLKVYYNPNRNSSETNNYYVVIVDIEDSKYAKNLLLQRMDTTMKPFSSGFVRSDNINYIRLGTRVKFKFDLLPDLETVKKEMIKDTLRK
jgi:hypothetical protein